MTTAPASGFKLYPEERHWWSFRDYRAVLDVMARTGAKRVLEFGPGSSTLALIEGGAQRIDTCEDDPEWAKIYRSRLVNRFRRIVRMRRYVWSDPLTVPKVDEARYDLALIDGPRITDRRPVVLRYCLERCTRVLMPTEENPTGFLRPIILEVAAAAGRPVEIIETGPLAGAFALIGPRATPTAERG